MHIVGVVVRARPASLPAVQQQLRAQPGVEVHAVSPDGRLVITIEGADRRTVADTIYRLDALPGVLNASMTYEHSEPEHQSLEASQ